MSFLVFVHCLVFFGSWGTAWCSEHEASSLFSKHATAYRVNTFFPRIFFQEKEKRRTKKSKQPLPLPAQHHCAKQRESNWCCHKRAHCSCSFNTAQKISPRNEKCQLLPLWDCSVCVLKKVQEAFYSVSEMFAGFSLPTLPLTLAVFLWIAFNWKVQNLQNCCTWSYFWPQF